MAAVVPVASSGSGPSDHGIGPFVQTIGPFVQGPLARPNRRRPGVGPPDGGFRDARWTLPSARRGPSRRRPVSVPAGQLPNGRSELVVASQQMCAQVAGDREQGGECHDAGRLEATHKPDSPTDCAGKHADEGGLPRRLAERYGHDRRLVVAERTWACCRVGAWDQSSLPPGVDRPAGTAACLMVPAVSTSSDRSARRRRTNRPLARTT